MPHGRFVVLINKFFDKVVGYDKILTVLFNQKWFVLLIPIIVMDALLVLFGIQISSENTEYNGFANRL